MPQLVAAVASKTQGLEAVLYMAPENSDTSQFFIIDQNHQQEEWRHHSQN
jgi:hypothetical protein